MPGHGSVTAMDAFGVGLMAAVIARKSAHQNHAQLPLFAFDGMLGLVVRYLDLVTHYSRPLQVPSAHLLTDALLYPDAVPVEIRFDANGDYRKTHEDGLQLLDDLVGGSEEELDEGALSEEVYRYRHILEEEKRSPSDRGKPFKIHLMGAEALHRFTCTYTFADVSIQSARNLPQHDLHLPKDLEDQLRQLKLPALNVLALDPTSIAFWALEHVASSRNAPFHLLFLLRIVVALETEFAERGIREAWLAPASWYGCLATLSPEQIRVLQKGVTAVRRTKVVTAVADWEAKMRGRPVEPLVERYRDALACFAAIVNRTTLYAESLGEGRIDVEQAHLYPFLSSSGRTPSVPSLQTLRNVETYRQRKHDRHISTVPEELDSARSSVHGPHPGLRVSIEPNALTRKKSAEEADAYEAPSALEPSVTDPSDIDLSASEAGSPVASRRPSTRSAYEPAARRTSHASSSGDGSRTPTNFLDPSRTGNLWPTNEELGPPSSSSPETSPRQVRKKRSILNVFKRQGSGA